MSRVTLVAAAANDMEVIGKAIAFLKDFSIPYDTCIYQPGEIMREVQEITHTIEKNGSSLIIAAAGELLGLPALMAAHTCLPVIAVPVASPLMNGLDALMAAVKVPKGSAAPAVAIDGGENAGLLAIQILSVNDSSLTEKLKAYRLSMKEHVRVQNMRLKEALTP